MRVYNNYNLQRILFYISTKKVKNTDKWLNIAIDNKSKSENCSVSFTSKFESASQDVNNAIKIRKCVMKYNPEYINIEFTAIYVRNEPRP